MSMSTGLDSTSRMAGTSSGSSSNDSNHRVQFNACGSSIQPTTSSAVAAAGTRLRRRLSTSLPRDSHDRGLGSRAPRSRGTHGSNHGNSCQSPRIQRERRLTSTR